MDYTDQEKQNKIARLLNDDAFNASVSNCTSPEELREAFAKHGVDLGQEEASEFILALKLMSSMDDELTENQLDDVTGGTVGAGVLLNACLSALKSGGNRAGR